MRLRTISARVTANSGRISVVLERAAAISLQMTAAPVRTTSFSGRIAAVLGWMTATSVRVAAVSAIVLFLTNPAFSDAGPKTKKIFELISLGEPVEMVVGRMGEPDIRKESVLGWYKRGPGSGVSVIVHEGRVAAVATSYLRPAWIKFSQLKNILSEKYGRPLNLDIFPSKASTPTRKISAILLGKGRAARRWRAATHTIRLFWTKPHSLFLRYDHPTLWKAYLEKREKKSGVSNIHSYPYCIPHLRLPHFT